jgi:hypothetical protein
VLDSPYDFGGSKQLPTRTGVRVTLLILFGSLLSAYGAEPIVGSIKTVQGSVLVKRGTQTIPATEGMHLLVNDILQTVAAGRVGAILQDGTRIGLGPDTELKIDSFIYQPADQKFSLLLHLARGVIAYVSGKIAKLSPGSVSVETPVGVIGLRGTHMAITIEGT